MDLPTPTTITPEEAVAFYKKVMTEYPDVITKQIMTVFTEKYSDHPEYNNIKALYDARFPT